MSTPTSFQEHALEGFEQVDACVFPSNDKTISVQPDPIYGGAHVYAVQHSLGFNPTTQQAETGKGYTILRFVYKPEGDAAMVEGLQSEQLILVVKDRLRKLNNKYPSKHNDKQMAGLDMFLEGCQDRIEERLSAGVMGQLKNVPEEEKK